MANSGVAINDAGIGLARVVDTNEIITVSTTLATAVTVTGSQSVNVASSAGMVLDQLVSIDTGSNYEIVQVLTLPDGTHFTAVLAKTHLVSVIVGQASQRQIITIGDPSVYANQAKVDAGGLSTKQSATNGTFSTAASSITVVTLLASNVNRRGVYITNESASATLYVGFGAGASLTAYTYVVPPYGQITPDPVAYTGIITGIWSAAVGNARITEITN